MLTAIHIWYVNVHCFLNGQTYMFPSERNQDIMPYFRAENVAFCYCVHGHTKDGTVH